MNGRTRNIIYLVILLVLGIAFYNLFSQRARLSTQATISDVVAAVSEGKVSDIEVAGNLVQARLKDGATISAYKEADAKLTDYGITSDKVKIEVKNPDRGALFSAILSIVLPFLLVGGLIYFMMRQAAGQNLRALSFGKSQARLIMGGGKRITFRDVAGAEEAKQELLEVVEFLKSPEKFRRLGAEIPKGVLLVGPPGTGKTLLAKAVAGEANVPFFSISASEFVEMFVGVGAARVRDLFARAKRNAPAILFIDEMDAVGRQRGTGLGGSHDEREQTLNQVLVEMDGFDTDTRVIVMAATNRPDVLDPALLRPGRFDRRVVLDLPDKKARKAILEIHGRGKPLGKTVNLEHVAQSTVGFSGADLKNVMNEAAIFAARNGRNHLESQDFDQAIEKVMLGPERKSRILSEKERKIAAYHEAGHAIVGKSLPNADPIHKISLVSRGLALGYTWSRPEGDQYLISKAKFEDEIAQALGGRVAERMIFREQTTGAANDLKQATRVARDMVTRYGMSEKLGPVALGDREELVFLGRELAEHKTYSEKIAAQIDSEVERIVRLAEKKATSILHRKKSTLQKLAKRLLEKETIEGPEFEKLFAGA
jgi:cell division protease FtsH